MSNLQTLFEGAVKASRVLPERPGNDTLLQLYALYKQATEGNASGPQPGFFDFIGIAKHEAWVQLAGMSNEEAMRDYVTLVRTLGAEV